MFSELDNINEKQLIRRDKGIWRYEVELRQRALTGILRQVGQNFLESATKGTVNLGGEIDKVMTKFDRKEIKVRRAFSSGNLGRMGLDNKQFDKKFDESREETFDERVEEESSNNMPSLKSNDSKF